LFDLEEDEEEEEEDRDRRFEGLLLRPNRTLKSFAEFDDLDFFEILISSGEGDLSSATLA